MSVLEIIIYSVIGTGVITYLTINIIQTIRKKKGKYKEKEINND